MQLHRTSSAAFGGARKLAPQTKRHKNDYGAIFICDSRFGRVSDGLSKWIQAFIQSDMQTNGNVDFGKRMNQIKEFYSVIQGNALQKVDRAIAGQLPSAHVMSKGANSYQVSGVKPSSSYSSQSDNSRLASTFDSIKSSYPATQRANVSTSSNVKEPITESDNILDELSDIDSGYGSTNTKRNVETNPFSSAGSTGFTSLKKVKPGTTTGLEFFKSHQINLDDIGYMRNNSVNKFGSRNYSKKVPSLHSSNLTTVATNKKNIPVIINLEDEDEFEVPLIDLDEGEEFEEKKFKPKSKQEPEIINID